MVVDSIDPALRTNDIKSLLSSSDFPPLGGRGFILDRSLERVFGSGVTMLAVEFERMSDKTAEDNLSDSSSTDINVPIASSSPGRKNKLRDDMEAYYFYGVNIFR